MINPEKNIMVGGCKTIGNSIIDLSMICRIGIYIYETINIIIYKWTALYAEDTDC